MQYPTPFLSNAPIKSQTGGHVGKNCKFGSFWQFGCFAVFGSRVLGTANNGRILNCMANTPSKSYNWHYQNWGLITPDIDA